MYDMEEGNLDILVDCVLQVVSCDVISLDLMDIQSVA